MIVLKKKDVLQNLIVGEFTREEIIKQLLHGITHIHSTPLNERDPCYKITKYRLEKGKKLLYPWEPRTGASNHVLFESEKRYGIIDSVINNIIKRQLREKARIVLEELITNAFYHAYKCQNGEEKYNRMNEVKLKSFEGIALSYLIRNDGLFVRTVDKGGSLNFETIVTALKRCYGRVDDQIETKQSGAGLGFYMIFESVTHICIECDKNESTNISCWISLDDNPNIFSFNFFNGDLK